MTTVLWLLGWTLVWPVGVARGRSPDPPAHARALAAGFLSGLGCTMIIPQGIVALALGQISGFPPGWFLALHVGTDERWLVAGAMIGVGLLLVRRSLGMFGPPRARTQ